MKELQQERQRKFSPDVIAASQGVSEKMFLSWLDKELEDEQACIQLPFALLLVAVFAALCVAVLGNQYVQDVQTSIDGFLRENTNFGYEYSERLEQHYTGTVGMAANSTAIQQLLPAQQQYAAAYTRSHPVPSDFLHWNHLVGGVRLTQSTVNSDGAPISSGASSCKNVPATFRAALGNRLSPCFGSDADHFPALQHELPSSSRPLASGGQNTVYLPTTAAAGFQSTAELQTRIANLETALYLRENVRKVQVSFFSLNREFGLWTMTTVSFTFRRGGGVIKDIYAQSTWLSPYGAGSSEPGAAEDDPPVTTLVLIAVWVGMNAKMFLSELNEMRQILRETRNLKRFVESYFCIWNVVDWITVLSAGGLVAVFAQEIAGKEALKEKIGVLSDDELYEMTMDILQTHEALTILCYVYVVITVLRLFKGFAAQPRLGVVTSTLVNAASETLHFLVVFSSVFFAYALALYIVFGRHLPEFSTLGSSVTTCWRIVFGDLDYEKIYRIAPWESLVFFFSFTLLVVLIMLNMLLAIVIETYMDVKRYRAYAKSETLYSQAVETVSRFVRSQYGQRVTLNHIRDQLLDRVRQRLEACRERILAEEAGEGGVLEEHKELFRRAGMVQVRKVDLQQDSTAGQAAPASFDTTATGPELNMKNVFEGEHNRTPFESGTLALRSRSGGDSSSPDAIPEGTAHEAKPDAAQAGEDSIGRKPNHKHKPFFGSAALLDFFRVSARQNVVVNLKTVPWGRNTSTGHSGHKHEGGACTHADINREPLSVAAIRSYVMRRDSALYADAALNEEHFVTVHDLVSLIPEMRLTQAERVLRNALEDMFDESEQLTDPPPARGFEVLTEVLQEQVAAAVQSSEQRVVRKMGSVADRVQKVQRTVAEVLGEADAGRIASNTHKAVAVAKTPTANRDQTALAEKAACL
eukprot:g4242.t1